MAPAAYIHIPFCRRRCGYCNFTVVPGRRDLQPAVLQAIERELEGLGHPREIKTLFLGGGTPTQLDVSSLRRLGCALKHWFVLLDNYEFTVEANPEDLQPEMLEELRSLGINRISLGVQSFDDQKLATLQRRHRRDQVFQALRRCREGFDSLAIDLIFAAPGESLATWRSDLAAAIASSVDHVSTYGLTYEKGAAFWGERRRGRLQPVGEETELAMFETAIETLTEAGFEHYEVSNFARPGHRCRHNVNYWQGGEYYAFGPGASRYMDGRRETNHRSTTTYLKRVLAGQSPVAEWEHLDAVARARERLVFQLRMVEGVRRAEFLETTGYTVDQLLGDLLPNLVRWRLLDDSGSRIRLTREGLLVSDEIWGYVLVPQSSVTLV